MTTTPDIPIPDDDPTADSTADSTTAQSDEEAPGAEIGMSEGEGSSFEPEEDPQG